MFLVDVSSPPRLLQTFSLFRVFSLFPVLIQNEQSILQRGNEQTRPFVKVVVKRLISIEKSRLGRTGKEAQAECTEGNFDYAI